MSVAPTVSTRVLRSLLVVVTTAVLALGLATVTPERVDAWTPTIYVGLAQNPVGGRWLLRSDGVVETRGGAAFHGDVRGLDLNGAPLDIVPTPSGNGYWILGADGGIFTFGDARFYGSTGNLRLNQPIVGMAATPSGNGYWLVATDGGIFTFGDARFYGSTGDLHLNQPIVDMATTSTGGGYWLVATDGGIFTFGDARFYGSTGALRLNRPIIDIATTGFGDGYWLTASDGGIFTFGHVSYLGAGVNRGASATAMIPTPTGYAQLLSTGEVLDFPGAETKSAPTPPVTGPHAFLWRPDESLPPARWDACDPILVEVNYAGSQNHGDVRQTLQQAIDMARAATGLDIRILRETSATSPSPDADAIVYWSTSASQGGIFDDGIAGFGGGAIVATAVPEIVSGQVVFNGSIPFQSGFGASSSFGDLALHELAHMLGLGHIGDASQVMYPVVQPLQGYANGDREGLWWVGSAQGCLSAAGVQSLSALSLDPEPEPVPFGVWD